MATVFKSYCTNFPVDQQELDNRLKQIEKLINKPHDNISFVESTFQLMQDCGLITEGNVNFLLDPDACRNFKPSDPSDRDCKYDFYFMRNPSEGALRNVNDYNNVNDAKGDRRFYSGWDRRVELNGENYLLSNDWYNDYSGYPNKRAFYLWLKENAQDACNEYWADKHARSVDLGDNLEIPVTNKDDNYTAPASKEPDDLKAVLSLLNDLHKKIDNLNEKFDNLNSNLNAVADKLNNKTEILNRDLTQKIEDVTKEVNALYKLWE